MAYISFQPSDHFNTKLYTGNDSTNAVTGVGFQPDFVWLKPRNTADHHRVMDAVRTASYFLSTNQTSAQSSTGSNFASFDSDGFTLGGSDGGWNSSSNNYVTWNWLANGQGSANSDGTITTTYTSANTTSGVSIMKYTGTGSNASIGHGLGAIPHMAIFKRTDTAGFNWFVYHRSLGAGKFTILDSTGAGQSSTSIWQNTTPTSSVITLGGDGGVNASGGTYICYAFAEKKGFSKFGEYSGNSNADGTFVYLGFKPALIIVKKHYGTTGGAGGGDNWEMIDTKRDTFNVANKRLFPNVSNAESSSNVIDIVSNGFKIRTSSGGWNEASNDYIYLAFAEEPLVSSNDIPATAR